MDQGGNFGVYGKFNNWKNYYAKIEKIEKEWFFLDFFNKNIKTLELEKNNIWLVQSEISKKDIILHNEKINQNQKTSVDSGENMKFQAIHNSNQIADCQNYYD